MYEIIRILIEQALVQEMHSDTLNVDRYISEHEPPIFSEPQLRPTTKKFTASTAFSLHLKVAGEGPFTFPSHPHPESLRLLRFVDSPFKFKNT